MMIALMGLSLAVGIWFTELIFIRSLQGLIVTPVHYAVQSVAVSIFVMLMLVMNNAP